MKMAAAGVKLHDLFTKGNKKEGARCREALEQIAPGVPLGFVLSAICGVEGDYPDAWGDFLAFDKRWMLDWVRLHAHNDQTSEWISQLEADAVWFSDRKEALVGWQRSQN